MGNPDTFFRQERASRVHSTFEPNTYATVAENGDVMVSSRVTLTVYCRGLRNMHQSYTCPLEIASYGHETGEVLYDWETMHDPIQENPGLWPGGDLTVSFTPNMAPCSVTTNTGTYSCIKMEINLGHDPLGPPLGGGTTTPLAPSPPSPSPPSAAPITHSPHTTHTTTE